MRHVQGSQFAEAAHQGAILTLQLQLQVHPTAGGKQR